MAERIVYVCDRCEQRPRFAILTVDLAQWAEGDEDVTKQAVVDVCAECLAVACRTLLDHVPMGARSAWYAGFRSRAVEAVTNGR